MINPFRTQAARFSPLVLHRCAQREDGKWYAELRADGIRVSLVSDYELGLREGEVFDFALLKAQAPNLGTFPDLKVRFVGEVTK